MGRRARMVVAVCNAMLRMTIKRGGSVDELLITERNAIMNLTEDVGTGGDSSINRYSIIADDDGNPFELGDYLVCNPWSGGTVAEGGSFDTETETFIAKPWGLRHSRTSI